MNTFERSLDFLKRWEGIDSNHPADRGGRTRFGISQAAHPDVDVPNLTWEQARDIYRTRYWGESGANRVGPKLAFCLFDSAVQHGPRNAIKMLQRAVKVADDGVFGPITERAVQQTKVPHLEMCAERAKFYSRIVQNDPSQAVFLSGWFRRLVYAVNFTHSLEVQP